MYQPIFPPKQIVKVILEESESIFHELHLGLHDEVQEMVRVHLEQLRSLETYEEINSWLYQYRRMSLQEWVESL